MGDDVRGALKKAFLALGCPASFTVKFDVHSGEPMQVDVLLFGREND